MEEGRDEKGRFTERNLWSIMKKRVGKPKIYPTPEELAFKAIEYMEWATTCDKGKFTFAGLRFYVGFSRQDWHNYKNKYPEYFDTMNQIETMLEDYWEKKLGWGGSTQGAIFWLKNKAGWKDESTVNENVTNLTAKFGDNTIQPSSEATGDTQ